MNQKTVCACCKAINRRSFCKLIVPGVISLAILSETKPALAQKNAKALVLSCIDFPVLEAERYFLSLQNLTNQYDFTALAGASLALTGLPHPADAQAFWDQLELSYRLHHIQKVIIIDHQDCTVYADKIDPNLSQDPAKEQEVHTQYLSKAYWAIRDRYPDLNIELYFLTSKAEVNPITPIAK
ncbi:carbonic anhydrase [Merismopedia glauca]|uniref:Carbonic anhydrase n=1 Tax=Merismopedia glauca CCAP 1448/3 TaxID=1296344 RepID=A0A2T1BZ47_9CYAN|nr:carbonic anhydrase [Merismopedia glauca]PSB01224.1 carbonic anhydrase [Merismopedia glauca CCAP 1448/3]